MKKNSITLLCVLVLCSTILTGCSWGKKNNAPLASTGGVDYYSGAIMDVDSGAEDPVEDTSSGTLTSEELSEVEVIRSGDMKKCDSLSGSGQDECRDAISYDTAIESLNYDVCTSIEDETTKKKCIVKISKELYSNAGGVADCSKIEDPDTKSSCIARFKAVFDVANGLASCAALSDKKSASQCADEYYLQQIRTGGIKDVTICDKISNTLGKRECRIRVNQLNAATTAKDGSVGETIKADCAGSAYCMKQKIVAEGIKSGNVSMCSSISDINMQKTCVTEISANTKKTLFDNAVTSKDPALCEKISDANAVKRCKDIVGK